VCGIQRSVAASDAISASVKRIVEGVSHSMPR
jgi:hypothetical protein